MTGMIWIFIEEPSAYGEMWWKSSRRMSETAVRVEFFGDEMDRITEIDVLTGEIKRSLKHVESFRLPIMWCLWRRSEAADAIEEELEERVEYFQERG